MQDLRQSPQFARFMEKIGWQTVKIGENQAYLKHLPILGNFAKIPRPKSPISPKSLKSLPANWRVFALKIDYSPTKTLQIDLTQSLEQIHSQFQKDARYEIRKAEENQIKVKESEDIETFIKIWHQNALRRGFWIPFGKEIRSIYEAFGENAYLLLSYQSLITNPLRQSSSEASHQSPISGALILIHNKVAYYYYAASTPEGRKLSAPYLVVWETIKLAKKKGCQIFDFEGIYDERFPQKSWKGFTHFKKSFGGKEVEYPGSLTKFYNPVFNLLFSIFPAKRDLASRENFN